MASRINVAYMTGTWAEATSNLTEILVRQRSAKCFHFVFRQIRTWRLAPSIRLSKLTDEQTTNHPRETGLVRASLRPASLNSHAQGWNWQLASAIRREATHRFHQSQTVRPCHPKSARLQKKKNIPLRSGPVLKKASAAESEAAQA